jgi:phosphatidylinositol alpha 1,6-mannosyltransferase
MRIVFFTESMLPLVDGVSLTLSQLFRSLEDEGVDFRVYAPFMPGDDVSWQQRVRKVRSMTFPLHRTYRLCLPGGQGLQSELDEYAPDIVHVVSPTPMAIWAQNYARGRSIPLVATFHTHFVSYFPYYRAQGLERVGWSILRWFHGRCTATYAPSDTIVEELRSHGIPNVDLWSRGVDTVRFAPERRDPQLRARLGADDLKPLVLLVSRLVREKDLADLVRVNDELRRRGLRFRLALVGDGPMRAELERRLPDAFFAGHQTGLELARWYASADIFAFPSTTETFANVVQEAMASGVPSVVVDRGGPQTVIEPGRSGFVARAHDIAHMADHIELLIRDPDRRAAMSRAGRQRALSRSWNVVNASIINSYRELARTPRIPLRRLA